MATPAIRGAGRGAVTGIEYGDRTREVEARGAGIIAEPQAAVAILAEAENDIIGEAAGAIEQPQFGAIGRNEQQALAARTQGHCAIAEPLAVKQADLADKLIER